MNDNDDKKIESNNINFDEEIALLPVSKPSQELIDVKLINNIPIKMEKKKMLQMNDYGVENLKKVGIAVASLVDAGIKSHSDDGKITFSDISHFIKTVPYVISGIPAISYVKQEIIDKITQEELNDFKQTVLPHLEVQNELDQQFIEMLIDTIHMISKLAINRVDRKKEVSS
jgi:hypothetical protein